MLAPMTARTRRSRPPLARSASTSVPGATCQSMRQVSSGWGWIRTWRPGFQGGSKKKRRSRGNGSRARMSQIRNRSGKEWPGNPIPIAWRTPEWAPSAPAR